MVYVERMSPDQQQQLNYNKNQNKSIVTSRGMASQLRSDQKASNNLYYSNQNQSFQNKVNNSRSQNNIGLNTTASHDEDSFIMQHDRDNYVNNTSAVNLTNSFQISESYGISQMTSNNVQQNQKLQSSMQKKYISIFNSARKNNSQRQDLHADSSTQENSSMLSHRKNTKFSTKQGRRNLKSGMAQNGLNMVQSTRDLPQIKTKYQHNSHQTTFQSVRIQQNRSQEDLNAQQNFTQSKKNYSKIQLSSIQNRTEDQSKILIKKSRNYIDQSSSQQKAPRQKSDYQDQTYNLDNKSNKLSQSLSQRDITLGKHKSDNLVFQTPQKRMPASPIKHYQSYVAGQQASPGSRKISIDDQSNSLERLQSNQQLDLQTLNKQSVSLRSIHKLNMQSKFLNQSAMNRISARKSSIENGEQESQFMDDDILERLTTNNQADGEHQHSQNYDMRRVGALDYLLNNLEGCISTLAEKNYFAVLKPLYQNIVISKLLTNYEVIYQQSYILAKVLVGLEMHKQGLLIYYFMRDIAEDMQNYENLMLAYYHIALCLQEQKEYEKSIIAVKRMLGLAWVCNHQNYERKAYQMLSNQYFYLGILKKSKFYTDRASRGKIEGPMSVSRKVAKEVFVRREKVIRSNNVADDAYEQDIRVTRKGNQKIIDITLPDELYERIDHKILQFEDEEMTNNQQIQHLFRRSLREQKLSSDSNRASLKEQSLLNQHKKQVEFNCLKDLWLPQVKERMMGNKMIRQSTPIERININDVPSPSEQKHDQMLLPNLSQTKANELDLQIQSHNNPYSNNSFNNKVKQGSHTKNQPSEESIFTKFDDKSVEFSQKYGYQTCIPKNVRDYLNFPKDYAKTAAEGNKDKLNNPFNKPLRPEVIKSIMDSQSGRTATKDKLAEQSNKNVKINQIQNKKKGLDYLTAFREARVNHKVEMQKKMTMKDIVEQSKINATSQNKQYAFLSHIQDTSIDESGKVKQKKNFTACDQERRDIVELMEILRDRLTIMKDYSYITKKFRWDKFNSNKTIEIFYGDKKGCRFPNQYFSQPQF